MVNIQCVLMFHSKRQAKGVMMKYNKLYLAIVTLLYISEYAALVIPGRTQIDQQPSVFLLDDSGSTETSFLDGSDFGTGSDVGLPPIPFLALALLLIPMVMMPMMSTTTSTSIAPMPIVPPSVSVTVPTTQATVQTTTCVPTNCPADYRLLNDQTASPNCYYDSGSQRQVWSTALKAYTATPGAYLWRPNSQAEADVVKNTFGLGEAIVYTGAHSPTHDENFVYAVENTAFLLYNAPFGRIDGDDIGQSCMEIYFSNASKQWIWENDDCDDKNRFICEFPIKTCP